MTPSEYHAFLKRLDSSVVKWQGQVESLNVEKLNVTFVIGKDIEQEKDVALKNLSLVRQIAQQQLIKHTLANDIDLDQSLEDAMNMLAGIVSLLPEDAQAARWGQSIPSVEEFGAFVVPLRRHVLSYADELQARAEKCSR